MICSQDTQQFLIKRGVVQEKTQEFILFKRANITKWGAIQNILLQMEKYLSQYNVPIAYVDTRRLVEFCEEEFEQITHHDLLDLIANGNQIAPQLFQPNLKFKGPNGQNLAAVHIQKNWRRYKAYSAYSQLRYLMEKSTIIQRRFRLYQLKK